MSVLSNRHVVTTLLVAPVLAIAAWYLTGQLVANPAEQPAAAESGASYPMLERSGCRYAGGACGLSNGDFKIVIDLTPEGQLRMRSALPLDYVLVGRGSAIEQEPLQAVPVSTGRDRLTHDFAQVVSPEDSLRVVAGAGGSAWFGEAALKFMVPAN